MHQMYFIYETINAHLRVRGSYRLDKCSVRDLSRRATDRGAVMSTLNELNELNEPVGNDPLERTLLRTSGLMLGTSRGPAKAESMGGGSQAVPWDTPRC